MEIVPWLFVKVGGLRSNEHLEYRGNSYNSRAKTKFRSGGECENTNFEKKSMTGSQ